jgi:hypothetical protein
MANQPSAKDLVLFDTTSNLVVAWTEVFVRPMIRIAAATAEQTGLGTGQ